MPERAALLALARQLLPPGVAVAAADPRQPYPLLPGEALPHAVPARLAEFSAGRHAARAALAALGVATGPIPMADDRAPIWPQGVCGSITHSTSACLAAVRQGRGLGLDLEPDEDLPGDLWDTILRAEETEWARRQPDPGRAARLVFAAKEAAYKAQYAESATIFGFDAMLVGLSGNSFTATFCRPVAPFAEGQALSGRWGLAGGHILTAVSL